MQTKFSLSDRCILSLIKMIKIILCTLNLVINSQFLSTFVTNLPDTLYSLGMMAQLNRDDFEQYVVCGKCYCTS